MGCKCDRGKQAQSRKEEGGNQQGGSSDSEGNAGRSEKPRQKRE
jgi:hypothetical protein